MKNIRKSDLIEQMSHRELMLHLYLTQIILITIALCAALFIFDHFSDIYKLFLFNPKWVLWGFINGVAVVALDIGLINVLPKKYYDDGGINNKLLRSMWTWQIPLVALMIAISEELLFRGVVQTKLGLILASLIFAVIHVRYWSHWYLIINVVLLSFWIGLVYQWAGQQLPPVIAMHFTIDCLLGIYIKYFSAQIDGKKGD